MLSQEQIQQARLKLGVSPNGIEPEKIKGSDLLNKLKGVEDIICCFAKDSGIPC